MATAPADDERADPPGGAVSAHEPTEGPGARSWGRRVGGQLQVLALAFVLMLLVRAFLVQSFSVPSGSMQPTLEPGDRILVSRLHRGPSIQRGDIVVFDGSRTWGPPAGAPPADGGLPQALRSALTLLSLGSGADYVKRVVGMPGDRVRCCDAAGRLSVNGTPVLEPYVFPGNPPSTLSFDVLVPEGRIWVMGDHRSASADSRAHLGSPGGGMVELDDVVGRAVWRYWPADRLGTLTPAPALAGLPTPGLPATGATP